MIVGIDEVGRGAWAGPLVVGAVLLGGEKIDGLTDSKKLSKKQRERLDLHIRQRARGIGIGWVSAKQVDIIGLSEALKLASRRAISHIHHEYDEIIIDGTVRLLEDKRVTLMPKADLLVPSVSAASIIAKVARDNYMKHLDSVFDGYKFAAHVGYGTAVHRAAIEKNGITPLHRLSFAPLAQYTDKPLIVNQTPQRVVSKSIGQEAETIAANYLARIGHEIIARNWRTKFCEIDIVSKKDETYYFTEVKYRSSVTQGGGIAAITKAKQCQMKFAAELYVTNKKLHNSNLRLAVIDMAGSVPEVQTYLVLE